MIVWDLAFCLKCCCYCCCCCDCLGTEVPLTGVLKALKDLISWTHGPCVCSHLQKCLRRLRTWFPERMVHVGVWFSGTCCRRAPRSRGRTSCRRSTASAPWMPRPSSTTSSPSPSGWRSRTLTSQSAGLINARWEPLRRLDWLLRLNASVDLHFGGYSKRAVKSYSHSFRIIELRSCVKVEVDVLGSRPW